MKHLILFSLIVFDTVNGAAIDPRVTEFTRLQEDNLVFQLLDSDQAFDNENYYTVEDFTKQSEQQINEKKIFFTKLNKFEDVVKTYIIGDDSVTPDSTNDGDSIAVAKDKKISEIFIDDKNTTDTEWNNQIETEIDTTTETSMLGKSASQDTKLINETNHVESKYLDTTEHVMPEDEISITEIERIAQNQTPTYSNDNGTIDNVMSNDSNTDFEWTSQTEPAETKNYYTTEYTIPDDSSTDNVWVSKSEPIKIDLYGSTKTVESDDIEWISTTPEKASTLVDCAVVGGYDASAYSSLWIIRAWYEGDLIPGKLLIQHGVAYVPWGGMENSVYDIEVLCSRETTKLKWESRCYGKIPPNAIVGGIKDTDEHLFIGRAEEQGSLIPGKVHPSLETMYLNFQEHEIQHTCYQVLCYDNSVEFVKAPENATDIVRTSQTEPTDTENYYSTEYTTSDSTADSASISKSQPIKIDLYGSTKTIESDDIEWISTTTEQASTLAECAVVGGYDALADSPLWIIRAWYEGDLIPGKLLIQHEVAYVPWGGMENSVFDIEVLCSRQSPKLKWQSRCYGEIPVNAIIGGIKDTDEHLFIGRAEEQGSLIPGKVHPSLETMYLNFQEREIQQTCYQVLCYDNSIEFVEAPENTTDIERTSQTEPAETENYYSTEYTTPDNTTDSVSISKSQPIKIDLYGSTKTIESDDIEWISTTTEQASTLADCAVIGGYDSLADSQLWIIRAWYKGDLIPGKLLIQHEVAYVPWGGMENSVYDIEVLCSRQTTKLKWESRCYGKIPANAIVGGIRDTDEHLFIGRAEEQGSLIPGKVHPSLGTMYFNFEEREIQHTCYQVLCYDNSIEFVEAPENTTDIERTSQTEPFETENYYTTEYTTPDSITDSVLISKPEPIKIDLYGSTKTIESDDIKWISMTTEQASTLADCAVVGGYDSSADSPLWIIRAWYEGDLIPGKLLIQHGVAYVPWGGMENSVFDIEVLCSRQSPKLKWESRCYGKIPANAIVGGIKDTDEHLFIGRAEEQGSLIPGKVHPSLETMFLNFQEREIQHTCYQVLCYDNSIEFVEAPVNTTDIERTSRTEPTETENNYSTEYTALDSITDSISIPKSEPVEIYLYGLTTNFEPNDIEWISTTPELASSLADCAVVGGYDASADSPLWIIRAWHMGDLIPGKLLIQHEVAYVSWGGMKISVYDIEVLCSRQPTKLQWKTSQNGAIPAYAIVGGITGKNEHLFIGRAEVQGSLIPGKVHPSLETMYYTNQNIEIKQTHYEVLCYDNSVEVVIAPENTTDIELTSQTEPSETENTYTTEYVMPVSTIDSVWVPHLKPIEIFSDGLTKTVISDDIGWILTTPKQAIALADCAVGGYEEHIGTFWIIRLWVNGNLVLGNLYIDDNLIIITLIPHPYVIYSVEKIEVLCSRQPKKLQWKLYDNTEIPANAIIGNNEYDYIGRDQQAWPMADGFICINEREVQERDREVLCYENYFESEKQETENWRDIEWNSRTRELDYNDDTTTESSMTENGSTMVEELDYNDYETTKSSTPESGSTMVEELDYNEYATTGSSITENGSTMVEELAYNDYATTGSSMTENGSTMVEELDFNEYATTGSSMTESGSTMVEKLDYNEYATTGSSMNENGSTMVEEMNYNEYATTESSTPESGSTMVEELDYNEYATTGSSMTENGSTMREEPDYNEYATTESSMPRENTTTADIKQVYPKTIPENNYFDDTMQDYQFDDEYYNYWL